MRAGAFGSWCRSTRSESMKRARPFILFSACVIAAVALGVRAIVERDEAQRAHFARRPIAEVYNPHTGKVSGLVYAIEKEHRFPNGKVEEGWLIGSPNLSEEFGEPVWLVKPQKGTVVWRK
jgi:hypothetical protein